MMLSGTTRVVGIFGDPVAHSLSPKMQNAALADAGIDAVYVPFHVTEQQLSDAISAIRALGLRGVNLTIPHKEAACALVDELDGQARLIGAINTIVNEGGRLVGYNTDGIGLLQALEGELKTTIAGAEVLLLGAGGAARAALVALARAGAARIVVANRTRARAQALVTSLAPHFSGTAFADLELSAALVQGYRAAFDVMVNTTAVGLGGGSFGFELAEVVRASGVVYDMVYNARGTPLLHEARARGLVAADGLAMLAGQGEAAFALWFGRAPRPRVMRQSL
jgi:shikimate dehydrogenase